MHNAMDSPRLLANPIDSLHPGGETLPAIADREWERDNPQMGNDTTLPLPEDEWERDNPKEECGVFGIFAPGEEVARITFFGLFALQHRGQESAGIAVSDGISIDVSKAMGLVT